MDWLVNTHLAQSEEGGGERQRERETRREGLILRLHRSSNESSAGIIAQTGFVR
jgi:hypothetical protein